MLFRTARSLSCLARPSITKCVSLRHNSYSLKPDGGIDYTSSRPATTNGELPPDIVENIQPTAGDVDIYLGSKLTPRKEWANDPGLKRAQARAAEAGLPAIEVSPMQAQFLTILAKSMEATKILEIGTLWGYSTTFLTRALPHYGQIDTLELSPKHAEIASQTFLDADLYPFPKVYVGPALDTLKTLRPPGSAEGISDAGYDLVFIDADKERIPDYFQESLRLTRKGGVILVDNAVRRGRIIHDVEDGGPDVKGLRRFYDWIEQDAGKTVMASGIQTVGAKSWDGFAIAYKL